MEPRIRLAEDYKDWAHDSVYSDLLVFEQHLAELSSVIVLILESPGSLTELGLFAAVENFREKLLVIITDQHYKQSSFIRLGPIDYLEKTHKNIASCYSWLDGCNNKFSWELAQSLQGELAEEVRGRIRPPGGEKKFRANDWLHKTLLVAELINLLSALTDGEIKGALSHFGIEISNDDLRQTLYILKSTHIIDLVARGRQRFYVCADERNYLTFRENSKIIDPARFRTDALDFYRRKDKKRFKAITHANSRRG